MEQKSCIRQSPEGEEHLVYSLDWIVKQIEGPYQPIKSVFAVEKPMDFPYLYVVVIYCNMAMLFDDIFEVDQMQQDVYSQTKQG